MFSNEVLVIDKPMFTSGVPIVIDKFHEIVVKSLPPLPQNVYVERVTPERIGGRCTLRIDDCYHMNKNVEENLVVSVLPSKSAVCHLCFLVRSTHKEFMYIDELQQNGYDTIGVLDMRDVALVKDVIDACGIDSSEKKFVLVDTPINDNSFSGRVKCIAMMCNLESVIPKGLIGEDVRVNFLQYDRVLDGRYLLLKYPYATIRNFDMRLFVSTQNMTSNFPVITCVCFGYVLYVANASRFDRDIDIPRRQFDQLIRIIAQRIENYATTNAYLLEFKAYPAVLPLLKAFDDQWMADEEKEWLSPTFVTGVAI